MKNIVLTSLILFNLLQSIAYAVTPSDVLPDGVDTYIGDNFTARKGTVGATFINLKKLETLLRQPQSAQRDHEIVATKNQLIEMAPTLIKIKFFELFPLHEWKNPTADDPIPQAKAWFYEISSSHASI